MRNEKFHFNQKFLGIVCAVFLVGGRAFADPPLLSDDFSYPNGLITNEYAFYNPTNSNSKHNPIWELDSGSLFASNGAGWTGVPNNIGPNASSSNGNNSSVFRMNTKRTDFKNVAIAFSLLNQGLNTSGSTPAVAWDGIHIWMRYQSEYKLYYASINRRDNTVVIKKKVPGGVSNGGTYYVLGNSVPSPVPYNVWQNVKATVQNNANGSVTIKLYRNNVLLISATDNGTIGGAPITGPGRVGLRGDNANLKFDNFVVTSLDSNVSPPAAPGGVAAVPGNTMVSVSWNPVAGATSYNLYRSLSSGVTKTNGFKLTNVQSPYMNTGMINGQPYYMIVTAVNADGESAASAQVSATPLPIVPPAPTGVNATPGDRSASIAWHASPGAVTYNLYRSRYPGVTKTNGYKIPNVASPRLNTGFTNGTRYYMVVSAVNALGEGPISAEVSVVPGILGGSSFASLAASDLTAFRVFPNPWKTTLHNSLPITFDNLTADATVKIFTLAGQWVTTLQANNATATWDLRNNSGERVASGLYMYLITNDQNQKNRGTFAVIQ